MKSKQTQRLDKVLSHMGIGTRSELKKMAKQGRIAVNGKPEKDTGVHVDPERDAIEVDGTRIAYKSHIYLMLHKPQGVISATEDARDRTVLDLLSAEDRRFAPFPVGRLDKDTEGLLLLTNDGKLAHELLSPRKHVDKTYYAKVSGQVTERTVESFRQGVQLDDGYVTLPAELYILSSTEDRAEIELTIREGKFHQVKRMFEAVGAKVTYLKRIRMGGLALDPALPIGKYRPLTEQELDALRNPGRPARSIRLLALDVDGTLLDDEHRIGPATLSAVRQAAEQGILVVLCTGRGQENTVTVMQELGLQGVMITHNGAAVMESGDLRVIGEAALDREAVRSVVTVLRERGIFFDVSSAIRLYAERLDESAEAMYRAMGMQPHLVDDALAVAEPIVKVCAFCAERDRLDALEQELRGHSFGGVEWIRSGDQFIDFLAAGVSKGAALRALAERLGIKREEVMAIGNYYNDTAMLQFAGIGIAMDNSPEAVKLAADAVTSSNNEDGVAEALRQHVFG